MKKMLLACVAVAVLLLSAAVSEAGALKEGLSSAGEQLGKGAEPVGEDVDYMGRSVFYGIGAVVIAPFRFLQDAINAMCQGAANEKLWDHTN